jgi:hypothetical protein
VVNDVKPEIQDGKKIQESTSTLEEIKQILKTKINRAEIKVGVTTLKSLNVTEVVETSSIEKNISTREGN